MFGFMAHVCCHTACLHGLGEALRRRALPEAPGTYRWNAAAIRSLRSGTRVRSLHLPTFFLTPG